MKMDIFEPELYDVIKLDRDSLVSLRKTSVWINCSSAVNVIYTYTITGAFSSSRAPVSNLQNLNQNKLVHWLKTADSRQTETVV